MYKPAPLFRLSFWLGAISLALCSLSMSALAGPTSLQATFTSGISNGWVKVERWRDTSGNIGQEAFPSDGRGDQSGYCLDPQ